MVDNATNRYLDLLAAQDRQAGGTGSNYKLAQLLGVERQMVSKWRSGNDQLSDVMAVRLADQLNIQPLRIIGEVNAEKARDARTKMVWINAAKKAGGKVAGLVLAVMMAAFGFSPEARAEAFPLPNFAGETVSRAAQLVDLYNAHISRRRRKRPPWWRWLMILPIPDDLSFLTGDRGPQLAAI